MIDLHLKLNNEDCQASITEFLAKNSEKIETYIAKFSPLTNSM